MRSEKQTSQEEPPSYLLPTVPARPAARGRVIAAGEDATGARLEARTAVHRGPALDRALVLPRMLV